jgi:hypothetical protein
MSTLEDNTVTHVMVDMSSPVVMPLAKFVELSALLGSMTPVRYDWSNSAYTIKTDGSKPEMKLLTVTDVAKIALSAD